MLEVAAAGEQVERTEGSFDAATMKDWGPGRTVRTSVLRHLLIAEDWPVHAKGVQLRGIKIHGYLDLEAATLRCPMRLHNCYLDDSEGVVLDYGAASLITITGSRLAGLTGAALVVTKDLDLSDSTFTGPLLLPRASITGQLICSRAQLTGATSTGRSLIADGMKAGGVLLDSGFTAAGTVRLERADVTGTLSCSGARLNTAGVAGVSLFAWQVKVGGDVLLGGGFKATGAVWLAGADIAGQPAKPEHRRQPDRHGW